MSLSDRLRKLEEDVEKELSPAGPAVVVVFGDDPTPDDLPPNTVAVGFDEEDRHL